jgi:hypothetical protein
MPLLLDRPVFIMAAPRSCSTLLFETMSRSAHLWSIGDESHQVIEQFPALNPLAEADSNRLTAGPLQGAVGEELGRSLRRAFTLNLRDRDGARPPAEGTVRLLEKTPKNALRKATLAALPDGDPPVLGGDNGVAAKRIFLERVGYTAVQPRIHPQFLRSLPATPITDPGLSRNAPCPCGSGRRYKHCHGAS